jgi:phospholipid-binding lipoprotein MlaA
MNYFNDQKRSYVIRAAALGVSLFLSGALYAAQPEAKTNTQQQTDTQQQNADLDTAPVASLVTKDPYEGFNRAMFKFNDFIDTYFMKPIATVYNKVLPTPLNQGIHNVFNNIENLPTIANDLLQLNLFQAGKDLWRLGLNTTLGVGGLLDIGTRVGLPQYYNDFGLTLHTWGYKNSNYLVLPFWGPTTVRDGLFSKPVDYYAFSIYPHIYPPRVRYGIYALSVVDTRAQLLKFDQVFEEAAFDKYTFVRNAYLQRRAYEINKNEHLSANEQLAAAAQDKADAAAIPPSSSGITTVANPS